MSWLAVIGGLISIVSTVVAYLKDRQAISAATAEAVAAQLKGAMDEIQFAQEVRDAIRADIAANPDKLRAPDPNSRD